MTPALLALAPLQSRRGSPAEAQQDLALIQRVQELYTANVQGAALIEHLLSQSEACTSASRTLRRLRRAAAAIERPL